MHMHMHGRVCRRLVGESLADAVFEECRGLETDNDTIARQEQ